MNHFDEIYSDSLQRQEAMRREAERDRLAQEAKQNGDEPTSPRLRRRLGIALLRWGNRLAGYNG